LNLPSKIVLVSIGSASRPVNVLVRTRFNLGLVKLNVDAIGPEAQPQRRV
jgi:hypothetical protein